MVAFGDRSMGGMYELRDYMGFKNAPSPFDGSLTEERKRHLKHGYYASVSFTDTQIGRLLDELDRLDLGGNTIIVLWGDHGWKLGEHNGWCKQTNYEVDTHAPLIIAAPRSKANGGSSGALVEFVDVFPTLCELAGLAVPANLEGKSIAHLLDDPQATVKEGAFSQFPRTHEGREYMGYTVRGEKYRYVEWIERATAKTAAVELYDGQADPEENENIAAAPANAEIIRQLSGQLWKGFTRPAAEGKPRKTAGASGGIGGRHLTAAELYDDTGDTQ